MEFSERARLLDPAPMARETGYGRLPSGVLHIAIRTDMHGCTGEMLNWWFASRPGTREYRWLHPLDPESSAWVKGESGHVAGTAVRLVDRLADGPKQKLSIRICASAEYFEPFALALARSTGAVSALLCVRGAVGPASDRTPDEDVIGTRMIHVGRNTEWGMVLRSHFFMGEDLVGITPPGAIAAVFPDPLGPDILQHCYDEFTSLARILPGIWMAEGCDPQRVKRPW